MSVIFPKNAPDWMRRQRLRPLCVAVDSHDGGIDHGGINVIVLEYVFDRKDIVLVEHVGWDSYISVEDHWNDDVFARAGNLFGGDHVRIAEELFRTSKGSCFVSKNAVDAVIYKVMVGDLKLYAPGK